MLVLSRKAGEQLVIDGCITVTVLETRGNKVRLGIDAPPEVSVHRQEVHQRRRQELADESAFAPTSAEILMHSLPPIGSTASSAAVS
jgi:carbon storage regulator